MRNILAIVAIVVGYMMTFIPAHAQNSAIDDAQCKSYGAQPGTDAYVNCRIRLQQMHSTQSPYPTVNIPPMQIPAMQAPRSTNCITNVVGNYAYTNCN